MQSAQDFAAWFQVPFDAVPTRLRRRVYRVTYVQLDDATGGRLWVTRHGWQLLSHLDPANWFFDDQFFKRGKRLSGGSGAVFRVSTTGHVPRGIDLVVKTSRMAQDVPLHVSSQFPHDVPRHVIDAATFNDPLQEFGFVEALRSSRFGPPELRLLTKRPLAVYSPGRRFPAWQLGRSESSFRRHQTVLANDQHSLADGESVAYAIDRRYFCLYHWVRGVDAETLRRRGVLSESEIVALMERVVSELAAKGFRMLDVKPGHLILRVRRDGSLLARHGRLVYLLVDFELLQSTEEYREWAQQRTANAQAR